MVSNDLAQVEKIEQGFLSPWSRGQICSELDSSKSHCLVAEDNERVVAWCCARAVGEESELLKISVHSEKQRNKIGSSLLSRLEEHLMREGASTVYLEVRSKNSGAIHFYTAHDYTKVGVRPRYYHTPVDDALMLKKDLIVLTS